ncbi:MAG TPA: hypothetical protein VLJ76_09430 [Gaiellaceae bacterium]|nr:hypothetical protein [Gaiellaceae bacterium]
MRAVVTSNVRFAEPGTPSAYLRVLDLESGSVLLTTPVPESSFRAVDPNPRGGQRGGRGLSTHDGKLVVANAERLYVLDTSWRLVDELSHPLAGDIHDVLAEERGIWVASTACDALVLLGWDGEAKDVWTYRSDRGLVRRLGLPRRALPRFDPEVDYRDPRNRGDDDDSAHLNSVARNGDRLLVMLGQIQGRTETTWQDSWSAVVELEDRGKGLARANASILCRRHGLVVPNHNAALLDGLVVFNDSNAHRLVALDPRTNEERHAVPIPGDPPYARGLARVGDGRWLVGSQRPLAVHDVDLRRGEIVASYPFQAPEDESVYAVCLLPDEFGPPPQAERAFWARAALPAGVTPIPA